MNAVENLLADAERLPFMYLVAELERLLTRGALIGGDGPVRDEPIRFRHDPSLTFHSSDVRCAELGANDRAELTTTFLGLTGSTSPLPASFVDTLAREDDEGALERDLLDIFHHRLLSLFYRSRLKHDLPNAARSQSVPRILGWLLGLAGIPIERAEAMTGLELPLLLRFLPLLVTYPCNAERIAVAIREAVADALSGATVTVHSMTGGLVPIDVSARARLGVDMRLGRNSTIGARAPSPSSEITVKISGLRPEDCARLCPGGDRHGLLNNVALLFTPEAVRVTLELTPTHAPSTRLGQPHARLGRSTWLGAGTRPVAVRMKAEQSIPRQEPHAS